jgi:hypothetical protein
MCYGKVDHDALLLRFYWYDEGKITVDKAFISFYFIIFIIFLFQIVDGVSFSLKKKKKKVSRA